MFERDDAKNAANIAKHGVSFEQAQRIFEGPVLTMTDARRDYGEMREISLGSVGQGAVLTVVHTSRRGEVRIISARPASSEERRNYERAIQGTHDAG